MTAPAFSEGDGSTMKNGLRLEGKKEASLISWTIRRQPAPPSRVRIPLVDQLSGTVSVPCVRVGVRVRTGEKIAAQQSSQMADPDGSSSVALHASISGEVTAIARFPHPVLGEAEAIEIQSDGRNEMAEGIGKERTDWQLLSHDNLLQIFRDSGLFIGSALGQTLVVNGCESEPYVTADHSLMMSHPVEILKGAEILRKATGGDRIIFALEDDKMEAAELLKSKIYFLKWAHCNVTVFPARYPQDAEEILKLEWPGAVVHDVATAFAVYEAVVLQKPFYERVVTVAGECVVEPRNVWVRIGTSFEETIKAWRGLMREPLKILMGGPMRGIAQTSLEVPVTRDTPAILALPKEVVKPERVEPCIRCGRCVDACPVFLSPAMITLAAERNLFSEAREWGLEQCIECGNCAYVCPAKRPMVELIQYAGSAAVCDDCSAAKP